ncbi:hypothetical protein Micbo1qcDRAFT_208490 [Microdochium bolleyi]|uniref:Uncharacterized protein n=1 Tax=Microdochium bolleyi TaxID=196109 RepID=A0A136IQA2_9PEZI|nr:hypothetical protein Micbo1qcDRAFT_208490 [Microdochium bolleyi]
MHFSIALSVLFAALTAASSGGGKIHDAKRQITAVPSSTPTATPSTTTRTTPTVNVSFASSLLNAFVGGISLGPMAPSATATLGIAVPETLKAQIYTAIPPTVLVQLMNNSYRSSVAANFAAGSTPAWYQSLSPELQTFFASAAGAIRTTSGAGSPKTTPAGQEAALQTQPSAALAPRPAVDMLSLVGVVGLVAAAALAS